MTSTPKIERKLTTILSADAVNFSGRMAENEVETVQSLRKSRTIFEAAIAMRQGRIANTAGDGMIAEFPSVVEAVAAAIAIQRELASAEDLLPFRIGLHLGDVIVEGDDLLGDGVNIAARLQEAAHQGGIFVSRQIVDQAKGRVDAEFRPLGPSRPKNFVEDIPIYAVLADGVAAPSDIASVIPNNAFAAATEDAHKNFKRSKTRAAIAAVLLFVVDLVNGAGPSWPAIGIAAIGISLFFKWRKLPKK